MKVTLQKFPFRQGLGAPAPKGQNSPSSHHWQGPSPGLYCPATQGLQSVSAFPLQNRMIPCPTAHSLHGIHALLAVFDISFVLQGSHVLVPPELNSPTSQGTHCVFVATEHAATKPSPTAQDLHGIHADFAMFDISFAWQGTHLLVPPELNSPSLQSAHCVFVATEHAATKPSPTAQDLHGIHVDFASFETSFAWQGTHLLVPPELNSPSLQGEHCVSASMEHAANKPYPTAHDLHGIQADLASFTISLSPQASQSRPPPSLKLLPAQRAQASMPSARK